MEPPVEREQVQHKTFAFFNALFKTSKKKYVYKKTKIKLPLLIVCLSKVGLLWEFLFCAITISTLILISYAAFFAYYDEILWDFVFYADVVFLIDVMIRLSVELWRQQTQNKLVIFPTPYTMVQFILDSLAMIPSHHIYIWIAGTKTLSGLSLIDFCRFNHFIRLIRTYEFFEFLKEEKRAMEKVVFIFSFTVLYLGFIHVVSCLLFWFVGVSPLEFILHKNKEAMEETWIGGFQQKKLYYGDEPIDLYVISTHFSVALVTTVGYGDFFAINESEMCLCIIVMLVGAILLSGYFTSQLTNFELETDGARFDLFFRLSGIKKLLLEVETLPFYNKRVEDYYKCLWTYREGVDKVAFQNSLPMAFQEDIQYDICQEMFDKSFLMHGLDEAFLRSVSRIVHVALYNPQMLLCRYGGYANKMFYILQGECVAVSKYDMNKPAAILRAGFLIGEANLFFSFPYTTSVETRTCCQFLILEKEELMKLFDQYEDEMNILRSRAQHKSRDMYKYYRKAGDDVISWVEAKDEVNEIDSDNPLDKYLVMRWGEGLCAKVTEDVIDDTQEAVICEQVCSDKTVEKNHLTPYMTCVIPEIMVSEMEFVKYWNTLIMICALIYAFVGPYCLSFGESTELEKTLCINERWFEIPNALLFTADVFVEIIAACPVYGLYYKFRDGLRLKKTEPMFYFDVLAGIPFEVFYTRSDDPQDVLHEVNSFLKSMKLWKVVRYLHYLDNENPMKLFWFRLGQTCLILLYGIHFIACIFFTTACPTLEDGISCYNNTWLGSYAIQYRVDNNPIPLEHSVDYLSSDRPYLLAFFFSSATLTSAGFGDFNPQNGREMLWACIFQLVGFFLIGYYTSVLTSALSCGVRPELAFQQKLVSIQQFMNHHHLKEALQDRIVEHYYLQHQFRGGITIPHGFVHFMYDAPDFLKKDVLYMEVYKLLEGIPIFTKCDAEQIISMSAKMQRFVVPQNITFIHRGEVRRVMYLIKYGSIGVIDDETNQPIQILESSAHIGIRDMLFGEPCHFTIKTLSHCCLYSITYDQVREVFEDDEELLELIDLEKADLSKHIEEMTHLYAIFANHNKHRRVEEKPYKIPSWIHISKDKEHITNMEFEKTLSDFPLSRIFNFFLLRKCVHPVGTFASFWSCLISIVSCLTIMALILETYMYIRNPSFRIFQLLLDLLCYADIYLKMHWGYYIPGGWVLVTSPFMTFLCYIKQGSFFMDVIVCAPFEWFTFITGQTSFFGYGQACSWYSTLRWTRFFQLTRIVNIFKIAHSVFEARNLILLIVYVSVTLLVCTIVAAYAAYLGCPWSIADYSDGDQYKLPMCLEGTWATTKLDSSVTSHLSGRWIAGVYYVSQVVLVIGFGDMITLSTAELMLLIFMSVFGFIFMRCVIADITAAEVDNDEIRAQYIEQLTVLKLVMARENVDKKLTMSVLDYLNHTWERAKGLQPQVLFADLHPALESDVFRGLIRDRLFSVPIFSDFQHNIARALCQYMHQLYFVKGHRLMRCDNMEYEMYIIVEGKVWITDRNLAYICSLTYGESFGESALLYGSRREFNAFAACDVVVYVLTSDNFLLIKQRYPVVQELFETKMKKPPRKVNFPTKSHETPGRPPSDLFVKKAWLREDMIAASSDEARTHEEEYFKKETETIFDAVATRENLLSEHHENLMMHESILSTVISFVYGYGTHDENLPFIYFARSRANRCNIVIHVNCKFMNWFMSIVYLLCYITPAISVYDVSFSIEGGGTSDLVSNIIKVVPMYFENIMLLHIALMFFTAVQTDRGYYVKDNKKIALAYLISLTGFWLDFVGSIPYLVSCTIDLLLAFKVKNVPKHFYGSKISNYVSLLRTVRLYRFYQYHLSKKDDLSISTFRYKMTLSISSFCLMVHVLSCVFYANSPCIPDEGKSGTIIILQNPCRNRNPEESEDSSWTFAFSEITVQGELLWEQDEQMKPWRWWVRSAYWVVTVISTTGFGDITAHKISEMVIAIICIFCGAFVLSIILSHFTSGMASITKFHREYLYQVKLLVKHLRNIGLSQYRQDQVMAYFLMVWDRSRGIPYHKATQNLPITMRIELCYSLYINVLKQVKMFRVDDEYIYHSLLRQVSLRLVHSYYIPGVCIVKEGEKGSSLFIVYKGQVSGTTQVQNSEDSQLKKVYSVGHVFGRFPALFRAANLEETYKKSYRAEEPTEILELNQTDILHLTDHFVNFFDNLLSLIRHRYSNDEAGESQPIFVKTTKKRGGIFDLTGFASITKGKGKKIPHIPLPFAAAAAKPQPAKNNNKGQPSKTQNKPLKMNTEQSSKDPGKSKIKPKSNKEIDT